MGRIEPRYCDTASLSTETTAEDLPWHKRLILRLGRRRRILLFWLGRRLAFLLLFLLQRFLLAGVFLQELLGLLLMLLLNLLFFGGIRLLLRDLGVFLLLLLLDCLAFLNLFGVKLILLLLVLRIQLGVRGWRNNGARRRWNLVGMDCRGSSRPTARSWLRSVVRV
jgi:hypothetical protein